MIRIWAFSGRCILRLDRLINLFPQFLIQGKVFHASVESKDPNQEPFSGIKFPASPVAYPVSKPAELLRDTCDLL